MCSLLFTSSEMAASMSRLMMSLRVVHESSSIFYMEKFEELAITSTPLEPKCWFRYVEDTFVIWSNGKEKLNTGKFSGAS